MKNRKVWKLILCVTLAAFLLWGCGSAEGEPAEEVGAAEATAEESVIEEEKTEETEKEEQDAQQPAEKETLAEEESVADEEIATDMPEAQVTTTANEAGGLLSYMESLDPQEPAIIIYNAEDGGTIINIHEGEHYNLKKGDQIIVNVCWDVIQSWAFDTEIVSNKMDQISNYAYILYPDYSKFNENQKFFYSIWLTADSEEEPRTITCYLTPPTE